MDYHQLGAFMAQIQTSSLINCQETSGELQGIKDIFKVKSFFPTFEIFVQGMKMVMNLVGDLERFLLVMTIYQFGILSKMSPIHGSTSHQKCSGVINKIIDCY